MTIVNYGHFVEAPRTSQIIFYTNEKGEDWYEVRKELTNWGPSGEFIDAIFPSWATVDADGVIKNVEHDPSRLVPNDRTVIGTDLPIEQVTPGMLFQDGALLPAPPVAPVLMDISDRQFFQQLSIMGLITQDEALAAVTVGTIPSAMQTFIDSLPAEQRFPALMILKGATSFQRNHPLVAAFGAGIGMSSDQIDALWQAAALL